MLLYEAKDQTGPATASVKKGMGDVEKSSSGVGKALGGIAGAGAAVGIAAAATAVTAAGVAFVKFGQQGADLELQQKKINTVFGDQVGVVNTWAAANAQAMGLTKTQAAGLAAGLADLLVPMGMSREAAAQMSTQTIGLAGALAEWSGGQTTAAGAADILTKAYLGETDGLKALGISISAADVEQRLLEKGQKDLTGAARQQAEAVAIQEMVFEKSTDAQAAYAAGTDSAARKQAENTARINEAKDALATGLAPAYGAVLGVIADVLPKVTEFATTVGAELARLGGLLKEAFGTGDFQPLLDRLGEIKGKLAAQLQEWGQAFLDWIGPMIPPLLERLGPVSVAVLTWVGEQVPRLVEALAGWVATFVEWVTPMIPVLMAELQPVLDAINDWIVTVGAPALAAKLVEWGIAFVKWVVPHIPMLLAELATMQTQIIAWIGITAAEAIIAALKVWATAFVDWVKDAAGRLPAALGELLSILGGWITDTAQTIGARATAIGGAIIDGVISGVRAAAGRLVSAAISVVQEALDATKAKFGISSPSLVWAAEVGAELINGVIDGIRTRTAAAAVAAVAAIFAVETAARPAAEAAGGSVAAAYQSGWQRARAAGREIERRQEEEQGERIAVVWGSGWQRGRAAGRALELQQEQEHLADLARIAEYEAAKLAHAIQKQTEIAIAAMVADAERAKRILAGMEGELGAQPSRAPGHGGAPMAGNLDFAWYSAMVNQMAQAGQVRRWEAGGAGAGLQTVPQPAGYGERGGPAVPFTVVIPVTIAGEKVDEIIARILDERGRRTMPAGSV